ncbi:DnaD domain protein [Clostridium aestuarii]|uniref:DnaD domain protein n=1 Tax=Clostridium aestuarii TaxID=338193 RepID=A0ABT4D5H8_9CLOT|nr:DnaD domain protein [Clostridium aestuarii]MCY6485288.1 DnaD domain protein [Clostridium aestuarii]
MSTFMFKHKALEYTPISNIFIDEFMPKSSGKYIKIYLLSLRYSLSGELGVNSESISNTLSLSEEDIMDAWKYWNDEGVISLTEIDSMGNFSIEFLDLSNSHIKNDNNSNLLKELDNNSFRDMMTDIEKLLGRPLSNKEMTMYLSWQKDFNYSPEIILLLIQYSISKGKTDYRYMEKIAISWHDAKIRTIDDAQLFIKKHEDKWLSIKKILKYMGINTNEVMKPQEQILDKWINVYKFPLDVIYKASDICFERINKADFKYIDAILNNWFKSNIKTLEDIEKKDTHKTTFKKNNYYNKNYNMPSPKDTFSNRKQRSYDLDEIEKKLLGWDNND